MAEAFELGDEASGLSFEVAAGVLVAAEVVDGLDGCTPGPICFSVQPDLVWWGQVGLHFEPLMIMVVGGAFGIIVIVTDLPVFMTCDLVG